MCKPKRHLERHVYNYLQRCSFESPGAHRHDTPPAAGWSRRRLGWSVQRAAPSAKGRSLGRSKMWGELNGI